MTGTKRIQPTRDKVGSTLLAKVILSFSTVHLVHHHGMSTDEASKEIREGLDVFRWLSTHEGKKKLDNRR